MAADNNQALKCKTLGRVTHNLSVVKHLSTRTGLLMSIHAGIVIIMHNHMFTTVEACLKDAALQATNYYQYVLEITGGT